MRIAFSLINHLTILAGFICSLGTLNGCLHTQFAPQDPAYAEWEALLIDPSNELGYVRLASHYQSTGKLLEAEQVYEAGLKNIPTSERLASSLGRLYLSSGQNTVALEYYSEDRLESCNCASLYLDRAQLQAQAGENQAALSDLSKALQLNPGLPEAWFWKGMLHSRQNQTTEALAAFKTAANTNTQQAAVWQQIAILQKQAGEQHSAIEAIKKALRLEPEDYNLLQMHASLLEELLDQGDQSVMKDLSQTLLVMIDHFPKDSWTLAHLGTVIWQSGNEDEGRRLLQSALALRSDYTWAQLRLAQLYLASKRWEDASFWLQEGLRTNPENRWALQQLAECYERLNRSRKAIELMESWMQKPERTSLALHQTLGMLYLNELEFDSYEQHQLKGLGRYPNNPEIYQELATFYQGIQRPLEAHKLLLRLLSKQPENESLILQVVSLEQKMGLNKQAKQRILDTLESSVPTEKIWQFWIELQLAQDASKDVSADLIEMLGQFPESEWAGVKLAEIFLHDEKYAAAEKVIEKAMEGSPESASLKILLGRLLEIQGKWTEALIAFSSIEKHVGGVPLLNHQALAYRKLGKPHISLKLVEYSLLNHDWDLWTWYQFLLLQPPIELELWLGPQKDAILQTLESTMSLQFGRARQQLTIASLPPIQKEILRRLAHQMRTGESLPSQEIELKEIFTQPIWVRFQLAMEAESTRSLVRSETIYRSILKEVPDHPWIHARLGNVYADLDQLERSQQYHARFLKIYPNAVWGNFRLAVLKTLQQEEPEAIRLYQQVLSLQPDHAASLNNLAWTFLTSGDPKLRNTSEALSMAQKAVRLQASVDHLDTLAEAYFQSGQPIEAIQTIRRAILITPLDSDRYPYLLKQFNRFRQGDTDSAPPSLSSAS
ncbi:MAG: tetratricopeptide repeat protein [Deltaproteobacteria bacterium]|nr:tetratricopeptide repeat protein [Deltaproteobacteria bacterium]